MAHWLQGVTYLRHVGHVELHHREVYALEKRNSLKIALPGPILQSILKVQGSGHFKFKLRNYARLCSERLSKVVGLCTFVSQVIFERF